MNNSARRHLHRSAFGGRKSRRKNCRGSFEALEPRRLLIAHPLPGAYSNLESLGASNPFPAVGILKGDQGNGSGTLVAQDYVLTAAHVAVETNLQFTLPNGTMDPIKNRFIWEPYVDDGADAQRDVAIVQLQNPITSVTPMPIVADQATYEADGFGDPVLYAAGGNGLFLGFGVPSTMINTMAVGYGVLANGTGAGIERAGLAVYDLTDFLTGDGAMYTVLGMGPIVPGSETSTSITDFSTPAPYTELSITNHGDSGGPALQIGVNGTYAIAGDTSDGSAPASNPVESEGDYSEDCVIIGLPSSPFPFYEYQGDSDTTLYTDFEAGGLVFEAAGDALKNATVSASSFGMQEETVTLASDNISVLTLPAIATANPNASNLQIEQKVDSGLQTLATFTDPDGPTDPDDFTAEINWGDGTSASPDVTTGTIGGPDSNGTFVVSGDHVYSGFGQFNVSVTITNDDGSAPATVTDSLNIYELPLSATGGFSLSGTYGTALANIEVATFTDPGGVTPNPPGSSYTALITWGSAGTANAMTTTGTVTEVGSTDEYVVTGSYTYSEQTDTSPDYTVSVEIYRDVPGQDPTQTADPDPAPVTVTDTATLAYPKLVGTAESIEVIQRVSSGEQAVATFTDPGKGENLHEYSASINWGDGTPLDTTTVQISGPSKSGVYTVDGAHTYAEPGKYTITVDLNHLTAPTDVVASSATILQNIGMLLLDRSGAGAFMSSGNGGVTITGNGDLVIDSSNSQGAIQSGNGNISAVEIDVAGSLFHSGSGNYVDAVMRHPAVTPDPLAALGIVPPSASALGLKTYAAVSATGGQTVTLNPGVYNGGINISGSAKVILNPGVYMLSGGGLSIGGNGTLTGNDVMIYNSGGQINLSGNAKLTITAPSPDSPSATGKPFETEYQGIALFQNPTSSIPISVSGTASFNVTGVIYAAKATLSMSGSGNSCVQGDSAKLLVSAGVVVYDFSRSGDGSLIINAAANQSLNVAPLLGQAIGAVAPVVVKQAQVVSAAIISPITASGSLTTVANAHAATSAVGGGETPLNPDAVDSVFEEVGETGLVLK